MKPSALRPMDNQGLRTFDTGIGATPELSLRVSVANLVRVLFESPGDRQVMLALERRATLAESGKLVNVQSQPFGGAVRIYDVEALRTILGEFHFDSEQSRAEQDCRIFIRPSEWSNLRQFCLEQFSGPTSAILETGPEREMGEEFLETVGIDLRADQYSCKTAGIVLESDASPTGNHASRGYPTVRIYRIFEARILDADLSQALLMNSEKYSDEDLSQLARRNARDGGPGWANTVLTLPITGVCRMYSKLSPELLNSPICFQGHQLDETVTAVLDDILVEKYQRL